MCLHTPHVRAHAHAGTCGLVHTLVRAYALVLCLRGPHCDWESLWVLRDRIWGASEGETDGPAASTGLWWIQQHLHCLQQRDRLHTLLQLYDGSALLTLFPLLHQNLEIHE